MLHGDSIKERLYTYQEFKSDLITERMIFMKKQMLLTASTLFFATCMFSTVCMAEEMTETEQAADVLSSVYENYVKEGSEYDEYKKSMAENFDGVTFTEELDGNTIRISIDSTNEYVESGSWEFVQDGDYLTGKSGPEDYSGSILFDFFIKPVGETLGMDPVLYSSYLYGLQILHSENDYYIIETDDEGNSSYWLYDAAPYEMTEIDDMYITEEIANEYMYEPSEDDTFYSMPIGKIRFVAHGNNEAMTMAIGEYEENTEKSFESLVNAVRAINPPGAQAFLDGCTELADAEGDGYRIAAGIDDDIKDYLGINKNTEGFSFYTVWFE